MTSRIHTITMDCTDWPTLVEFWGRATDLIENPDNPNSPGDPEGLLSSRDGRINLLFMPVPEGKRVKNRVHLDLMPVDRTRDEEVERLLGLGATVYADHREADGSGWVVLQDPEGNELCVGRSAAERAHGA